jgi:hypothetical protein
MAINPELLKRLAKASAKPLKKVITGIVTTTTLGSIAENDASATSGLATLSGKKSPKISKYVGISSDALGMIDSFKKGKNSQKTTIEILEKNLQESMKSFVEDIAATGNNFNTTIEKVKNGENTGNVIDSAVKTAYSALKATGNSSPLKTSLLKTFAEKSGETYGNLFPEKTPIINNKKGSPIINR